MQFKIANSNCDLLTKENLKIKITRPDLHKYIKVFFKIRAMVYVFYERFKNIAKAAAQMVVN